MSENKRILITDDDPIIRQVCIGTLKREGYNIETANDGSEAMDRLRRESFDLLILDVWMPRMTGLEVLSELRTLPNPPRTIVLTSDTTSGTVLQAIKEQAYLYIQKPFDVDELQSAVADALSTNSKTPPIEVISAVENWVELLVPCDRSVAERIPTFLKQLDSNMSEIVRDSVGIAFHELLRNALEWGGEYDPNRKVRIACLRTPRMILYRIADPGHGFDPAIIDHAAFAFQPGSLEHVEIREKKGIRPGGFGITMVEGLVDELLYNEARNEVAFIQYIDLPDEDQDAEAS